MIIRASSTSGYPDCNRRSASSTQRELVTSAGYELNQTKPEVGSLIGTSAHAVMESTLKAKLQTGTLGPLKQGLEYGLSVFDESTQDGIVWDSHASTVDQAKFQITEIAQFYYKHVSPNINPVQVEQELRGSIGDYEIIGHVDIIEPTRCRDKKTGIHKPISKAQMGAYSWLMKVNGYTVTDNPIIDWVPRKKPSITMIEYDLKESVNSARVILGKMISDIDRFQLSGNSGEFMANPHSQMCSRKLCPAHGTEFCKEWK